MCIKRTYCVLEWGSRGRKFESSHPDVNKSPEIVKISGLLFVLSVKAIPHK